MSFVTKVGCVVSVICICSFNVRPAAISVNFGPPESTREWVEYKIPLTADTFGVSQADFTEALSQIKSLMIKAEMSAKPDTASIDSVRVGSAFLATFDSGIEGWTIYNDATMKWEASGGRDGACITLLDWSSGSYFRAVSPTEWGGDWRDLEGDTIAFFIRVNRSVSPGAVILTTGGVDRLSFVVANSATVVQGDSAELTVAIDPAPQSPLKITFSSSDGSCINMPNSVNVSSGASSVTVMVNAAAGSAGCESTIQASASGYAAARISMTSVEILATKESAGVKASRAKPHLFRDCSGAASLVFPERTSGVVRIYSLEGRMVVSSSVTNARTIALSGLSRGMYIACYSLAGVEKRMTFCIPGN